MPAARAARVTERVAARVTMKVTARVDDHSPARRGRRLGDRNDKGDGYRLHEIGDRSEHKRLPVGQQKMQVS